MALIGNITTNYDASAQRSGFAGFGRRYSASALPLLDNDRQGNHFEKHASSGSDSSTVGDESSRERQEEGRILELARQFTRQSTRSFHETGQFDADDVLRPERGTIYDPFSENFNSHEWIKSLLAITSRDPDKYPRRTAGIAFKNLSVHGFASDVEYQPTVGNVILSGLGSIWDFIARRKRKVEIIKHFDGIVEAGEMLVVLGPPGR
jgi:ATP-binding cassette subfamily G (WHITE) protein 2 (PDR)